MWKTLIIFLVFISIFSCKKNENDKLHGKSSNKYLNLKLLQAIEKGDLREMEIVLKKGANPNIDITNNKYMVRGKRFKQISNTAITYFCDDVNEILESTDSFSIINRLRKHYQLGDKELLKVLFNRPLLLMIKENNFKGFKLLLKFGGSPALFSVIGTPLLIISEFNNKKMLKYLIINQKDYYLNTISGNQDIKEAVRINFECGHISNLETLLLFLKDNHLILNDLEYYNKYLDYFIKNNNIKLLNLIRKTFK